jgi:hypothetical protein
VHKEEGGTVEPGQYEFGDMTSNLTWKIDYTITKDMAMLVSPQLHSSVQCSDRRYSKVFAESWQLRSQLKADIRVQVRNLKSLFPDNFSGNPEDQRTTTRDFIAAWVADGSYLHDTVLDSVSVHVHIPFLVR